MSDISSIIQRISIILPALLFALVVHEFAHAWVAQKFGDNTAEWSGRLTLNPAAHIDWLGTIIFPLVSIAFNSPVFFGWAKPVPINPNQFKNYRKGLFWVSSAGPLSNIILGFTTAFVFVLFSKYTPTTFFLYEPLTIMLRYFITINFALAIFNLLPIPPLDGSNIVLSMLSYEATKKYMLIQEYSFYILLFLMFSNILSILQFPIQFLSALSIYLASAAFGFTPPL